jgi:hypothetical protein
MVTEIVMPHSYPQEITNIFNQPIKKSFVMDNRNSEKGIKREETMG